MSLDRRFIKDEGSFITLSQHGEPTKVLRASMWCESHTLTSVFVTKVKDLYRLENGETVIRKSPIEFECPSSGLSLKSEQPIVEDE